MKQIGLANVMYAGDNDDAFVPLGYYDTPTGAGYVYQYWYGRLTSANSVPMDTKAGLLQPYMKSVALQDCPEAVGSPPANPNIPFAYAFNYHLTVPVASPLYANTYDNMGMNGSQIEQTADTVGFADGAAYSNGALKRFANLFAPSYAIGSAKYSTVHGRHGGIANVNWMDGHAKGMKVAFVNTTTNGVAGKPYDVGDLLAPGYPYDPNCAYVSATKTFCPHDYYFMPAKLAN